jgi:hypothetical protein
MYRNTDVQGLHDLLNRRRLLRSRREPPRSRREAEKRDEFAPLYSKHGEFLPRRLASSSGPVGGRRLTLGLPHVQPQSSRQVFGIDLNCFCIGGAAAPCASDQG